MSDLNDNKHNKQYEIIVNTSSHSVDDEVVSYEQVVAIAYPVPPSPETRYTVTYRDGHKPKEGTLKAGGKVEVKKQGTIFNVKATGKS